MGKNTSTTKIESKEVKIAGLLGYYYEYECIFNRSKQKLKGGALFLYDEETNKFITICLYQDDEIEDDYFKDYYKIIDSVRKH